MSNVLCQAWYTARLMRSEELPELSEVLKSLEPQKKPKPKKENKEMTAEELEGLVKHFKMLNASFGGEFVEIT